VATASNQRKQRVPAAERRDALIAAAIEEFAQTGLHGTPVDRIARRVGVAQPYVFSLFPTKRDLFIAAVERGFERVEQRFAGAAASFDPETAEPDMDLFRWIGEDYMGLLESDRPLLMLQLQAYAACNDELIAERVRAAYAHLVNFVDELTGADSDQLDAFMSHGMWLNVQAAIGVSDLSAACDWIQRLRETDAQ
jgi:AcrR family transcriptional regulator